MSKYLEELKTRLFGRENEGHTTDDAGKARQIVVFDLGGTTFRLLKELDIDQDGFLACNENKNGIVPC